VSGEVFLAHADALADEVVLVALQLLLQPDTLALVRIFCLVRPLEVGGCEVVEVEDGGERDEAAVEGDVLAALCGCDGDAQGLARERRAVQGDVGEAERLQRAVVVAAVRFHVKGRCRQAGGVGHLGVLLCVVVVL
jgi:hypothetical protein